MPELVDVLRDLTVGSRVAEDEVDELSAYFVETDQFRRILAGEIDVIFGPKGAGKSAIYASILSRVDYLFDRGITLKSGEIPRGAPAFSDILTDPPTSEAEFVALWKFYVLSLINEVLEEFDVNSPEAKRVRIALEEAGLVKADGGLRGLVRRVRDYVNRLINAEAVEGGLVFDPTTGAPVGVTGKVVLGEPAVELRKRGVVTVDDLLEDADDALREAEVSVWLLFDRLDVAFADSRELETNALRSLFRVYLDLLGYRAISLKIFLRDDIWRSITDGGFREASHITRDATLAWSDGALLNLVVRRLLNNPSLVAYTGAAEEDIREDAARQREWFDTLVPRQIDSGRNPKTFEWILGRVKDGHGYVAPREVIHMLDQARQTQLASLERGEPEPDEGLIFTRAAFRDALPEVSRVRVEQTLLAEYPDLRECIEGLRGEKTNQSLDSLADLWGVPRDEAGTLAERLIEVGFFTRRGDRQLPEYWVPPLYRSALAMVQGSAD